MAEGNGNSPEQAQNYSLKKKEQQATMTRRTFGIGAVLTPVSYFMGRKYRDGKSGSEVQTRAPDRVTPPSPAKNDTPQLAAQDTEQQQSEYDRIKEENKRKLDEMLAIPLGNPARKDMHGNIISDPIRIQRTRAEKEYLQYLKLIENKPSLTDQQKLAELYRGFLGLMIDDDSRERLYDDCFRVEEPRFIETLDEKGKKRWEQIKNWCHLQVAPNNKQAIHPLTILLAQRSEQYLKPLISKLQEIDPTHYFPYDIQKNIPYKPEDLIVNPGGMGALRCFETGNFSDIGGASAETQLHGSNVKTRVQALRRVIPFIAEKIQQKNLTSDSVPGSLAPNDAESGGAMLDQLMSDSLLQIGTDIDNALSVMSPEVRKQFSDMIYNPAHPLYGLVWSNLFLIRRSPEDHRGGNSNTNPDDEYNAFDKWNQWGVEVDFLTHCADTYRERFMQAL